MGEGRGLWIGSMTYAVLGNNLVMKRGLFQILGPLEFDLDIIIKY